MVTDIFYVIFASGEKQYWDSFTDSSGNSLLRFIEALVI